MTDPHAIAAGTGPASPGRRASISRDDLLAAALRLLGPHRSVSSLSLREVTREAGIAPNSFYRQFRDMDELAVALIDLADDSATARNASIRGTVTGAAQKYSGVRLTVGVPFELNHMNPLTAPPPLDRGEMFWNWQSGHKFLRVDLAVADREWAFHVGSTGCSSASALRPPSQPCTQPNETKIELKGDPLRGVIRLRLEPLVAAAQSANFVACTGDYQLDPACKVAYAATGLQPGIAQSLWVLE